MRFVLVETSHPGNVGSVARAIKTMGFGSLVLVSPREPGVLAHAEAIAMAVSSDELGPGFIIPSVFDRRVVELVAPAVAEAARASGVTRV